MLQSCQVIPRASSIENYKTEAIWHCLARPSADEGGACVKTGEAMDSIDMV